MMSVKVKAVLTVAVTALAFSFSAAASAAEQTLRVGTEPTFAPFEFVDEKTNITGYDIDIINAIGEAEKVKFEIVSMPFDGLIPALLTGQLDVIIAGMTITPERKKRVAFSEPYYDSGLSAVILTENVTKYRKIANLSHSRICAQIGNTGSVYAQKLSGDVVNFNTHPEAYMELKAKGCEAVITDRPVNQYFLTQTKDDIFIEIRDVVEAAQFGIATAKDNEKTLELLNHGLQKIRKNGTFAKIHQKWFGTEE